MSEGGRNDSNDPPAPLGGPADGVYNSRLTPVSGGRERRSFERFEVTWSVDCEAEDTFLYASIQNISEMGIFVRTEKPLPVGMQLTLRFAPSRNEEPFVLRGTVQWINALRPTNDNPNPGMGICFIDLTPADRERIVETIRTIAYLREPGE